MDAIVCSGVSVEQVKPHFIKKRQHLSLCIVHCSVQQQWDKQIRSSAVAVIANRTAYTVNWQTIKPVLVTS